jgi:hypothetical protein
MFHKNYDRKCSIEKNISDRETQGVRRQDELIGGKPSVVKWLWLWLWLWFQSIPCGGGIGYHYRNPASRRRRRKGKSRIWDSKILSRIARDSDPRMTALVRFTTDLEWVVVGSGGCFAETIKLLIIKTFWAGLILLYRCQILFFI